MYSLIKFITVFVATLCLPTTMLCAATPKNTEHTLQIHADNVKLDFKTGNSVYRGHVEIIQQNIRLTGDEVSVQSRDGNISVINISGSPARYAQTNASGDDEVNALSQQMKYELDQSRLIMTKDARLEQAERIVESQRIVYDTHKQLIIAGQDALTDDNTEPDSNNRVNIILTPKSQ